MGIVRALKRFATLPELHNIPIITPGEARWITDSVRHSPDLGYLEQFEFQLLFTPDELRQDHPRYKLLEESALICGGFTEKTYAFWMQEQALADGTFERKGIPIRQDGPPSVLQWLPKPLRLKGELHAIRPWQFQRIDDYKRNTEQFRRQRVNIVVPYRKLSDDCYVDDLDRPLPPAIIGKGYLIEYPERVFIIRAWMYVAIPEYWNDLLDAGFRGFKPVYNYESQKKRPWLLRYYDFPKPTYRQQV
jgi:hypothetical protein